MYVRRYVQYVHIYIHSYYIHAFAPLGDGTQPDSSGLRPTLVLALACPPVTPRLSTSPNRMVCGVIRDGIP
jgi:hypothetical protein